MDDNWVIAFEAMFQIGINLPLRDGEYEWQIMIIEQVNKG